MNYYLVKAKCGHVRKSNYIIKGFYVKAESNKEAASIVRQKPRVKHNHKDAIRSVTQIDYQEYLLGICANRKDPYFLVHNSTDQRRHCQFDYGEIIKEEEPRKYKKITHAKNRLVESIYRKEWKIERNFIYE